MLRLSDRRDIDTLTGAETVARFGGAVFHDNKVWGAEGGVVVTVPRAHLRVVAAMGSCSNSESPDAGERS